MKRVWRLLVVGMVIVAVVLGNSMGMVNAYAVPEGVAASSTGVVDVGSASPNNTRAFADDGGRQLEEIVISGRPPAVKAKVASILDSGADADTVNVLSNVPAFNWSYGCSATSAAMLFGYYDNIGYPNMYAGPANGGVCPMTNAVWGYGESPLSASHLDIDGRMTKGHVDDYWTNDTGPDPYIDHWLEHSPDSTADFMGTSQSKFSNPDGSTTFWYDPSGAPLYDYPGDASHRDGCHGLHLFAESRGYTVETNFTQRIAGQNTGGFTFEQFKSEIDAGRPVLIHVTNHTMLGYGYSTADRTIEIHDTWDYSSHTMTWGGTYSGLQHYGVTVIRLAFTGPTWTVTTSVPLGNGTLTPSTQSVPEGLQANVTITPGVGYRLSALTDNETPVSPLPTGSTYTLAALTEDHMVVGTFTALPTYALATSASPTEGGAIGKSPGGSSYFSGTVVTLTATPAVGYAFTSWSGDLGGSTNPTTIMMDADKTVTAAFIALPSYTLTTTASLPLGGSIGRAPNAASYFSGTVVTLTATPAIGYIFTSWSADLTGATNPATITMTGNKTVTATFTPVPTYTLTPSVGIGGTIAPNIPQTVSQGGSKTFTITPNAGYHILDVLVDGSSVGAVISYTFTNVQANHTIHASFTPDTYTLTVTTPVNGVVTRNPDQATYACGTVVTLTATPAPGYTFTVWTGNLSGTTNPATITMTGNKTVTATFTALSTYTLTVTPSPSAGGSIAKSPDQSSYLSGTVVTLTATPAAGYVFSSWSGGLTGNANPATITLNVNKTVTATFVVAPSRTLSVSITGSGFVVKSPNQSSYSSGVVVTLTATPLAGYVFAGWSGDITSSANPTAVTMDANKVVTATFAVTPTYTLSTTASPSQGGTIGKSPNQSSYLAGTVVTLTATPASGYTFTGWSGDVMGTTNPTAVTIDGNKAVTATFTEIPTHTLTATASPTLGGTIERSPNLSAYLSGTLVTVTATPASGYAFTGWSGDLTGTTNPATITMTANKTVTAAFTAGATYTLTVTSPANGTVSRDPDLPSYPSGTLVTVTATPTSGYAFTGWSGDLTGTTNPATITMTANKTIGAVFLDLGSGSVYVVATLDGVPWTGDVHFSLTDGVSVITGSSVPFSMDEVSPGSFTIEATGGPAGKGLRYAPSQTQQVASGVETTYTLEFWSEPTVPGDIGITMPLPGDVAGSSLNVEGLAYGSPPGGSLLTVTARILPSGAVVTLVSNMHIDPAAMTWSGTLTATALSLSTPSDVEIVARLTGFPSGTEARVVIHWTPTGVRTLSLLPGWNLVGVSSPLPIGAVPGFMQCFGYQNGWSILGTGDVLQPSLGYWLQVTDAVDVILPGLETTGPVSVTYGAGWQLLGNPWSVPIPVTSITHWDLVMTCFLYGPAWGSVDLVTGNLEPGRGYWINLSAATTLTLTRP